MALAGGDEARGEHVFDQFWPALIGAAFVAALLGASIGGHVKDITVSILMEGTMIALGISIITTIIVIGLVGSSVVEKQVPGALIATVFFLILLMVASSGHLSAKRLIEERDRSYDDVEEYGP